jgi:hypothetical protein
MARMRQRERFFKPVYEQLGLIINIINSGEISYDDIIYQMDDYIDKSIFGNRWNSPVYRNTMFKLLREKYEYAAA